MSIDLFSQEQRIVRRVEQPDFPNCDLHEDNAPLMLYMLKTEAGFQTVASYVYSPNSGQPQRVLHELADNALNWRDIPTEYSEAALQSFVEGFFALETIINVVRPPHVYDLTQAAKNANQFLLETGEMADVELSESFDNWTNEHIRTYGTIANAASKPETARRTNVRLMGAHIAYLLQRNLLDAAA